MNFTYRGIIGGDSTSQINLWRRGKKHVAVFDGELPVSRMRRIRREMLLAEDFSLPKGPHDRHSHQFVIGRAKPSHEASATAVAWHHSPECRSLPQPSHSNHRNRFR